MSDKDESWKRGFFASMHQKKTVMKKKHKKSVERKKQLKASKIGNYKS